LIRRRRKICKRGDLSWKKNNGAQLFLGPIIFLRNIKIVGMLVLWVGCSFWRFGHGGLGNLRFPGAREHERLFLVGWEVKKLVWTSQISRWCNGPNQAKSKEELQ